MKQMVQSHATKIINNIVLVERRIQFQLATMTVKIHFYIHNVQYAVTGPKIPLFHQYRSVLYSVLYIQTKVPPPHSMLPPRNLGEYYFLEGSQVSPVCPSHESNLQMNK